MKKFTDFESAYLSIINEQNDDEIKNMDEVDDTDEVESSSKNNLDSLIEEYSNKETITKDDIIVLLNIAVCDELLASFNYMTSYAISKTEGKADFDPEFEKHEDEERDHAHKLIERLRELNGEVLTTPWTEYVEKNSCGSDWNQETSSDSKEILLNRYNEELNAIKFYSMVLDCIHKMDEFDSTTERMIKEIKDDEEEHELDLRDLLVQYGIDTEINTSMDTENEQETDREEDEAENNSDESNTESDENFDDSSSDKED